MQKQIRELDTENDNANWGTICKLKSRWRIAQQYQSIKSTNTVSLHWFALVCIGLHWFALVCIGLYWFELVCIGLHWFELVCNVNFTLKSKF